MSAFQGLQGPCGLPILGSPQRAPPGMLAGCYELLALLLLLLLGQVQSSVMCRQHW